MVWFFRALGHKVVNKRADIRGCAREYNRRFALRFSRGVDSGDQTLRCCLFIAGASIKLAGTEESFKLAKEERLKKDVRTEDEKLKFAQSCKTMNENYQKALSL